MRGRSSKIDFTLPGSYPIQQVGCLHTLDTGKRKWLYKGNSKVEAWYLQLTDTFRVRCHYCSNVERERKWLPLHWQHGSFCLYAGRTFIENSPGDVNNDPIKMAVAAGKMNCLITNFTWLQVSFAPAYIIDMSMVGCTLGRNGKTDAEK